MINTVKRLWARFTYRHSNTHLVEYRLRRAWDWHLKTSVHGLEDYKVRDGVTVEELRDFMSHLCAIGCGDYVFIEYDDRYEERRAVAAFHVDHSDRSVESCAMAHQKPETEDTDDWIQDPKASPVPATAPTTETAGSTNTNMGAFGGQSVGTVTTGGSPAISGASPLVEVTTAEERLEFKAKLGEQVFEVIDSMADLTGPEEAVRLCEKLVALTDPIFSQHFDTVRERTKARFANKEKQNGRS